MFLLEPFQATFKCKPFDTKQMYQTNRKEATITVLLDLNDEMLEVLVPQNGGLNSYQAVGLLCNFIRESSLIPNVESPFPACGIAGWTANRAESLVQFFAEMGDQPYNVKGYQIGGLETQAAFAAAEAYTGEKTGPAAKVGWIMYMGRPVFGKWMKNLDQSLVLDMTLDKSIDFTKGLTPDLWNSMQCPLACYLYAYTNFELGETTLDVIARGGNCAIPLHELLTAIEIMEGSK